MFFISYFLCLLTQFNGLRWGDFAFLSIFATIKTVFSQFCVKMIIAEPNYFEIRLINRVHPIVVTVSVKLSKDIS